MIELTMIPVSMARATPQTGDFTSTDPASLSPARTADLVGSSSNTDRMVSLYTTGRELWYDSNTDFAREDFIRRAHATNSASSNVLSSLDVQDIALIPDLDFVPIREEDNVERAKISAAYKRQ